MRCDFGNVKRDDNRYVCQNPGCGRVRVSEFPPWQLNWPCKSGEAPIPKEKVGTEFLGLTITLGLERKKGCSCAAIARWMDRLGIDGVKAQRAEVLAKLRENYDLYGLGDKLKAAAKAVTSGLAWRIDLRDPLGWMLEEAIRRAAQSSP